MSTTSAHTVHRRARYALGVALALGLLLGVVPSLSGVAWADITAAVTAVPVPALVWLLALWLLGLLAHTITLTAALPRLSHRQALTLSLTGSAVANVLPVGGAAGVALNYQMVRGWGFDRSQFAAYTVVTNLWDVLAKLLLPLAVVPVLLITGSVLPGRVLGTAVGAAAVIGLVTGLSVAALSSPRAAARVGESADAVVNGLLRRLGSTRHVGLGGLLVETQRTCRPVVRAGWRRLSLGMVLYTALLYVLLWTCLSVTGAGLGAIAVLAGFTVERLLTMAAITPGGAGVVEVALSAMLLLLAGDPAGVVSGVLLYRLLTFGLEIPVGGAGLAAWWWLRRRHAGLSAPEMAGA